MYTNIDQLLKGKGTGSAENAINPIDISNLSKAIEAGLITGRETTNVTTASGAPLKLEAMDNVLKNLTFEQKHLTIWGNIPKTKATNTVEEFAQMISYGGDSEGGFYQEGELPEGNDTTYTRRAQKVKFMGEVGQVTHVARLVTTTEGNDGLMAREVQNRTRALLRRLDRSIITADSNRTDVAFNGLYAQHAKVDGSNFDEGTEELYLSSERVIDLRGEPLNQKAVANAAKSIVESGYGMPDCIYADFTTLDAYRQEYLPNFLTPSSVQNTGAGVGNNLASQITAYGQIDFKGNRFMRNDSFATISKASVTSPKAPVSVVPGATPIAPAAPVGVTSKFVAADAGSYRYAVRARNGYGASGLVDFGNVTLAAGEVAELSFTSPTGANAATEFEIFRTKKDDTSGTLYAIFRVSRAQLDGSYNGAGSGLVHDLNWYLPGTANAFMLDGTVDTWDFRQLGSMYKYQLALTQPVDRFMLTIYGTPIMANNKRFVKFINIGAGTVPEPNVQNV